MMRINFIEIFFNKGSNGNMYYLIIFILIFGSFFFFSIHARGGQHETCIQKGGQYKAHYHCPEGYEAIIAGEGTFECDGECYRKGDKQSLKGAVKRIYERYFGHEAVVLSSEGEFEKIADSLLRGQRYRIEKFGKILEIRL